MTWLGNSLFNLKDQITTLTREVLADADEDVDQPKFVPIEKFNRLLKICEEKEDQLCQLQQEVDSVRNFRETSSTFEPVTNLGFGDANATAATSFAESDELREQENENSDIKKNEIEDAIALQSTESTEPDQNNVDCNLEEKQVQNVLQRIDNIPGKNRLSLLQTILKEVKSRYEVEKTKIKLSASIISFPSTKNSHGTDETMSNDSERSEDSFLNDFEILKPRSTSSKSLGEYSLSNAEVPKPDHIKCSAATQSEIELFGECKNTGEFEEMERALNINLQCWEDIFSKINSTFKSENENCCSFEEAFWADMNDLVQKNNEALKNYVCILARENKSWKEFYQSLDQNEESSSRKQIDGLVERELSLTEMIRLKNSVMVKRVSDLNAYSKKLENFNVSLNEVSDEILDKTVEVNSLNAELEKANEIKDQLEKENAELTEIITELRKNRDQQSLKLVENETELSDLQEKYKTVKNEGELTSQNLELTKNELLNLQELNSTLDRRLGEIRDEFCGRETELKLEIDRLREALLVAENEKVSSQQEYEEEMNSGYEVELSRLRAEHEILENDCQALRHNLEISRSELQKSQEANNSLDQELQKSRKQFCAVEQKLEAEIDRLLEAVRVLESERVGYQKESQDEICAEYESVLSRLRRQCEFLENENKVLHCDLEMFKNQLNESRELNDSLARELQETRDHFCCREEIQKLEIENLQEKLRIIQTEKDIYYNESQKEINLRDESIAVLNSRERTFSEEIESLTVKFSSEIDSLTSKINTLDEQKNILERNIENILNRDTENCGTKLRNIIECLAQFSSSAKDQNVWQNVTELVDKLSSENSDQRDLEASDRAQVMEELNLRLAQCDKENKILRERVSELEHESKQLNDSSAGLKNNVVDLENRLSSIMSEREQLIVSLKEKHNESLSYHSELQKVHALLVTEVEKNKEYDLQIEDLNKKLANNTTAVAELERLRNHLLSLEESYTSDLLNSEQQIKELRSKLQEYEDHLKSINAAQTSVNVRTNQITESLQKEIKFLTEEKEKLGSTLKNCQVELQRNIHDAQNLRSALDLFHRNKDSEIFQATEKLRTDIELLKNENRSLEETVRVLQNNLDVMKQKSNEKYELQNEIKCKEEIIKRLESKVKNIQNELNQSQEKIKELQADTENKFKLNLLKNIMLRYIVSSTDSMKGQALQILAEVLDFSIDEKRKVGLFVSGENKTENNPALSKNSLLDEFIRFVEKESNPKGTRPSEKKPNAPNALLSSTPSLPDVMLPTLSQFPVNHNSRYILKDVLQ